MGEWQNGSLGAVGIMDSWVQQDGWMGAAASGFEVRCVFDTGLLVAA